MQSSAQLIHTKLHQPFTRTGLVPRPRLQERILQGLSGPLTLVTAPAGFGKTTLVASCIASSGMPVAWLSLDKDDNHGERFLTYLIAALQEVDQTIGSEAVQFLSGLQTAPPEIILTSLINDLDITHKEMILVLDEYQCISSSVVHEELTFFLNHCPSTLHLVIATRSDPPLPLARFHGRGQMVELRASDLRFTGPEADQFLNGVMGLRLDSGSVAVLAERTEGWIAGLQMAALSMRDRKDIPRFIEGFSGSNRYILDYLLEEVLASQPPEIEYFLLCTSILERLCAPLCKAILEVEFLDTGSIKLQSANFESSRVLNCQSVLEHLERANLFLVPLDDARQWYRYHQLFADLLRSRLDQLYPGLAPQLHGRAAAWFEQNGSTLDAIHHASLASDFERIEHLIEQNYIDIMNRGEMSWVRYWTGKLSKEIVIRRPWLCLYEALSCSWFGKLEEAAFLLNEAEKRIRSEASTPGYQLLLGYHAYVKSRVTAMQGDTRQAIELCRAARDYIPGSNLGLQIDFNITLGYEYFLYGDFINAGKILNDMIQAGYNARAITNPVAGYAVLARLEVYQGHLQESHELLQKAARLIHEEGGQHLGVTGLIDVGLAALLCEWNDQEAALVHLKKGLDLLPMWGKADDTCLAYTTLSRIYLAMEKQAEAAAALEKVALIIQACGVFSEARAAVEAARVRLWLSQGDWIAIDRWIASMDRRFGSEGSYQYEDELVHIMQVRVLIARTQYEAALRLLSCLEEPARSGGRFGRLIEIMILQALALQGAGYTAQADAALYQSLALAEPEGYLRVYLDEGWSMQMLLARWLADTGSSPLKTYAAHLLSQFGTRPHETTGQQGKDSSAGGLAEPLSQRELEVLKLMALGKTNQDIAHQLIVAVGTVKAHTTNIYRKLDVTNRTEAVAHARHLGILP